MVIYDFLETDSDDYYELFVNASFETSLDPSEITGMLRLCVTTLESEFAQKLFIAGLTSLKLSLNSIEIVFRFTKRDDALAKFPPLQREYLARGQVQFVFWLFAQIDQLHKLGDVPFPPDFRNFITFPEEFEI